jgi:Asp-tRNA(Asn)/Glu-tRNA(Gln) amidotransferase A subunit family amidase
MGTNELSYLELTELTRRIHGKEISPTEATLAQLARIEALDKCCRPGWMIAVRLD